MNRTPLPSGELSRKTISSSSSAKKQKIYSAAAKTLSVLAAFGVWWLAAALIGNSLLATPYETLERLFKIIAEDDFFSVILKTFFRIAVGLFSGIAVGTVFAVLAARFKFFEIFLWPYTVTVKSIPVASFTVVALILLTSSKLVSFVSFLMVAPVVYTNLLDGINSLDIKMLELAKVYKMPALKRFRYIRLPALKPFILSALKISIGLSWKSGVAAELIGIPSGTVGEKLYFSKVYFDTAELFAWTLVVVLLSLAFEKLFILAVRKILERQESV